MPKLLQYHCKTYTSAYWIWFTNPLAFFGNTCTDYFCHGDFNTGPTLMFERFYSDKPPRKFFACAVHRDRKGCPFFVWADEKISEEKRERWEKGSQYDTPSHVHWMMALYCINYFNIMPDALILCMCVYSISSIFFIYRWEGIFHEEQSSINCEELWRKYSVVRTLPPDRRYHCLRCGVLLLESDLAQHEDHDTRGGVTDEQLLEPTGLVTPKDNKKSQAVRRKSLVFCTT